jgi:transposase
MHRDGLSDRAWQQLAPLLPQPPRTRGRPRRPDRLLLEGMVWIARTGAPWRDLPPRYGPWQTVYHRCTTYRRDGVWQQVLQTLQGLADQRGTLDWSVCCIDGSVVRAHVHAAGARKRPARADDKRGPKPRRKPKRWAAAVVASPPSSTSSARGKASRSPLP